MNEERCISMHVSYLQYASYRHEFLYSWENMCLHASYFSQEKKRCHTDRAVVVCSV